MIQRKKNGERNRALRYLELICIDAFYVKLFTLDLKGHRISLLALTSGYLLQGTIAD